ncbi:hypothetical protein RRG08_019233 [Elysia crispata]|uniref:Uncharacterized protein n=1 Tax=Elysia crispata TaxID=231223 RepID=A0AAE1ATS3_9GAST|nr:hypothetical protein RRG08_019233 [Elysia crispata]
MDISSLLTLVKDSAQSICSIIPHSWLWPGGLELCWTSQFQVQCVLRSAANSYLLGDAPISYGYANKFIEFQCVVSVKHGAYKYMNGLCIATDGPQPADLEFAGTTEVVRPHPQSSTVCMNP